MSTLVDSKNFNRADRVVEGWYWAMRSSDLKKGERAPLEFLGRSLVIYRGEGGHVVALDAYCPHMGAHLAEGRVEGDAIRCLFHHWKYNAEGRCVEIPCLTSTSMVPPIRSWSVVEHCGLIWIWAGDTPREGLPHPPELDE